MDVDFKVKGVAFLLVFTRHNIKKKKTRKKFVYKKEPIVGLWCEALPHQSFMHQIPSKLNKKDFQGGL